MSVHVIEYRDGAKMMRPIPNYKEYAALRNSKRNREMTRLARDGDTEAKRKMIQFCYSCMPNEGRLKGATVESNSVGMDVDFQAGMEKSEFERQFEIVKKNILAKADEIGLLMLERSATKGLHVVFRRRTGMTQEENLKWAAKTLGVEYDAQAKDITRVFFTPTADAGDLFFCKDELFEAPQLPQGGENNAAEESDAPKLSNSSPRDNQQEAPSGDVVYFGYNFTKIIKKYWELYNGGAEPVVGNRNALIFDLARSLRSICDYNINVLKLVIPRYADLPEEEYEQCLKNALDEPRKGINFKLQKVLIDNLTDAVFNRRVADAANNGNRYLYLKVDELDTLKKITSHNSAQEVSTIIRKAFDNSLHGQERVGSASVTGIAPLRFNFNASCCPKNAQQFFRYNITDGTITRLSLSTIIKPEGARPVYGHYDEEYRKTVDEVVGKLQSFRGNYVCQEANDFAQRLCDENERLAEMYDSEGYLVLSYRATVIAWLKGMVLWLLNGQQWTQVIEDYVRWALRYDLWCKMLIFGEMLEKELSDNKLSNNRGPQNLCEMLPERFRLKDLENLRVRLGKKGGSAKNLLHKWKARGIVTFESVDGEIVKCSG